MAKTYTVKKGDSLWKIAKDNNISLEELIKLNPTKEKMIHPNDVLRLEPDKIRKEVNIRNERLQENRLNLENVTAIQGYKHDSNYVIIDKKNRQLTIYDKDNNPLYITSDFSTGASGNDYNTITYVDKNGHIINGKGNNSTPAGILEISGKGTYHGYPSFTRARTNRDGTKENVASSLHYGNIGQNRNASNGCVRIGGNTLREIEPLLSVGTRIYTLPEKEGSRFTLRGGKLNFTADNPYGETEGDERFWDDYNTNIDKSYAPLKLKFNRTGNKEYDDNRRNFAQSIVNNKRQIQELFGLTSDEYNNLAELALGIAEQESKFGTSTRYTIKQRLGERNISDIKGSGGILGYIARMFAAGSSQDPYVSSQIISSIRENGNTKAISRGFTQIKNKADSKQLQEIYNTLGIDDDSIKTANKSALATIARLAYMYTNEVKGRTFTNKNNQQISPYHALLYKWNGHNERLVNRTATPEDNQYIRNVNTYGRNFDMYEDREYSVYKLGGRISLEDL